MLPSGNTLLLRWRSTPTAPLVAEMLSQAVRLAGFQEDTHWFVDMRFVDLSSITKELARAAAVTASDVDPGGPGRKVVYLVTGQLQFGIMRMYASFRHREDEVLITDDLHHGLRFVCEEEVPAALG